MSWTFIKTNRTPNSVDSIKDHIMYRLESVMDRSGTEKNFHDNLKNLEIATMQALSEFLYIQQQLLERWKEQQARLARAEIKTPDMPKPDAEPDGFRWPEFKELRPPKDEEPIVRESSSERRARQRRERELAELSQRTQQYSNLLVDTEGTNRSDVPQGRLVVPMPLNTFNDLLNFDTTAERISTREYEYHISSRGWSSYYLVEHDFTNRLHVEVPLGLSADNFRTLHTTQELIRFREALGRALQVRTMQDSIHRESIREAFSNINIVLSNMTVAF